MAKEGIAFEKYPVLCELEVRHEVDIDHGYKTALSAKLFTHYITQCQHDDFLGFLSQNKFYSFLMDGSTDAGRVEQELVIFLSFKRDDTAREIKSYARFLSVGSPKAADTNGLIECLSQSLLPLGITNLLDQKSVLDVEGKPILVGGGTDGASVNIAQQNGIMGMIRNAQPWLMWSWCYAHRLELSCKNALACQLFKSIEDMLLHVYYLYEKPPKKIRQLGDIMNDLKEVFEFPAGGNIPVRSQGSRWINHKRKPLQRVVDRYGAYITHLTALTEDSSLRLEDKERFKGYLRKWTQYKTIFGCALYVDILKLPSILSLSLQGSLLDIVLGIKIILKSVTATAHRLYIPMLSSTAMLL